MIGSNCCYHQNRVALWANRRSCPVFARTSSAKENVANRIPESPVSKSSRRPVRVLFIGNSFTARNDLPGLIAQLAIARGVAIKHELLSIGGASLRTHWNKGEARRAIQQ